MTALETRESESEKIKQTDVLFRFFSFFFFGVVVLVDILLKNKQE